jgi:hypothetical protein
VSRSNPSPGKQLGNQNYRSRGTISIVPGTVKGIGPGDCTGIVLGGLYQWRSPGDCTATGSREMVQVQGVVPGSMLRHIAGDFSGTGPMDYTCIGPGGCTQCTVTGPRGPRGLYWYKIQGAVLL